MKLLSNGIFPLREHQYGITCQQTWGFRGELIQRDFEKSTHFGIEIGHRENAAHHPIGPHRSTESQHGVMREVLNRDPNPKSAGIPNLSLIEDSIDSEKVERYTLYASTPREPIFSSSLILPFLPYYSHFPHLYSPLSLVVRWS